jgi:flagellar hook-length control protein FliK
MTNILSGSGNRLTASEGPAGINTQAVIDQIMDAKQSMNNGFGRVRITLDPPNLGTVNLEIVVRKERVEVVITADNSGVQQALQSRVDDVRTALQRQDLKIENFQILLQDNGANQQQANSGAMFGQHQEHQARQNLIDGNIPTQPLIQPIRESEPVRGLVSIFV